MSNANSKNKSMVLTELNGLTGNLIVIRRVRARRRLETEPEPESEPEE